MCFMSSDINPNLADDPYLREGLNVHAGRVTHAAVASSLGHAYWDVDEAIRS